MKRRVKDLEQKRVTLPLPLDPWAPPPPPVRTMVEFLDQGPRGAWIPRQGWIDGALPPVFVREEYVRAAGGDPGVRVRRRWHLEQRPRGPVYVEEKRPEVPPRPLRREPA